MRPDNGTSIPAGWLHLNSEKRHWVAHLCGFVSCKGGVFLFSLFHFLFSIFWQLRAQLAGGEVVESADAPREFADG